MASKQPTGTKADRDLAAVALEKRQRGEKPTREEAAAVRRVERARDEELRAEHYSTIRKKDWRKWSGRQDKILNEQATRYGVPIGGAVIELPAIARWVHDFLAEHTAQLGGGDDQAPANRSSPATERLRAAKALREEFALARDQGLWVRRAEIHGGMARIASIIRRCGDALLRQCDAAAKKILDDAIDDAQRETDRLFATDGPDDDQPGA